MLSNSLSLSLSSFTLASSNRSLSGIGIAIKFLLFCPVVEFLANNECVWCL